MRPGMQRRSALAFDHLERGAGLEDLLHEHASARGERAADRHRDAGGPEERIGRVEAVVRREAQKVGEPAALEHGRALRVQHALRLRRGARGVDDQRVVGGLDLGRHRVEQRVGDVAALREQLAPGLHSAGRFVEIEADHAPQLRQSGHAEPAGAPARDLRMVPEQILDEAVLAERGLQQQQRRIAVAQDVVPLGGARERVQRHGHAADAADCIRRDDPLRPVRHPDRHARALHHAGADQSPRELAHLLF